MRAFVTGATGVVGGSLVAHLIAEGDGVTAYTRYPAEVAGARVVRGSLFSHDQLTKAMAGHDVVFHVAAVNELCTSDPRGMYRVNVDGARAVARAAAAAGVPRLVYTSSVAAASPDPPSHYARSKQLGEAAVLGETGVDVVAVRPASVQGPGRVTGSAKVVLDILSGRLRFAVDALVSVVDIDDCATGHRAAACTGRSGAVYTLSGFTMSIRDALNEAVRLLGRDVSVRFVPADALVVGAPLFALARLWGASPMVCPEMVRTLKESHVHDGEPAATELGFTYRSAQETITRLLDWFVRTGAIS